VRDSFLRQAILAAVERLGDDAAPRWGRMRAQEMVEHLLWAFELSTGRARTVCDVPPAELPRMRRFLFSNRASPREFMNPALVSGLPPLRFPTLADAKAALRGELQRFLDAPRSAETLYTHPVFGPIGYDEWHRTHYKHACHHLLQFGLIEDEAPPTGNSG
jgi:oxepin-CoA hydrolase/3-oxo-5,6-dehydrosuberyl-CoA semialdehyde dehydrogenase